MTTNNTVENHTRHKPRTRLATIALAACLTTNAHAQNSTTQVAVLPLIHEAGRFSFSNDNPTLIAFDRPTENGRYTIEITDGEKTLPTPKDFAKFANRHCGNPAIHPTGRWIVFQAEKEYTPAIPDPLKSPMHGIQNELHAMDLQTGTITQIQSVPDGTAHDMPGLLEPFFSPDGKRLGWSERLGGPPDDHGVWVIRIANFAISTDGIPRLAAIRTYRPEGRPTRFQAHCMTGEDTGFILGSEQKQNGWELFTVDLKTKKSNQLIRSTNTQWNRFAHVSPDGKWIAWSSSRGQIEQSMEPKAKTPATELWIMRTDGTEKRQATWFNTPQHPHHFFEDNAAVSVVDVDWRTTPEGRQEVGVTLKTTDQTTGQTVERIAVVSGEW